MGWCLELVPGVPYHLDLKCLQTRYNIPKRPHNLIKKLAQIIRARTPDVETSQNNALLLLANRHSQLLFSQLHQGFSELGRLLLTPQQAQEFLILQR